MFGTIGGRHLQEDEDFMEIDEDTRAQDEKVDDKDEEENGEENEGEEELEGGQEPEDDIDEDADKRYWEAKAKEGVNTAKKEKSCHMRHTTQLPTRHSPHWQCGESWRVLLLVPVSLPFDYIFVFSSLFSQASYVLEWMIVKPRLTCFFMEMVQHTEIT